MNIIKTILNEFKDVPDLIIRKIPKRFKTIYVIYLETVSSSDLVNNYILRALATHNTKFKNLPEIISAPNLKTITLEEVEYYLCNGFAVITDNKHIYAFEARADLTRGIDAANVEPSLYGPKDSFVENYQINIGLIKRRIKSKSLKTKEIDLGRYSETKTGVLYIDNIVKIELVNEVLSKLNNIDTESITSSGELKQFLADENKNVFPALELSERPDTIVKALLSGKVVIIVDTSPFAIILPSVLADHINPTVDNLTNSINTNFLKFIRILCFIITLVTPAIYIAITNYNHESVPTKFLMNIAVQRFGVPFPSLIEALIMLFICELLRESDLRFPNGYGSAISILGALIIGESAVASGLASPIMIIVIALTFLSSLIFNEVEMSGALRWWRYIFLIFAGFFGLYGFALSLLIFLINLCAYESFSLTYMFPISPFDYSYLKETLFKPKRSKNIYRSKYLSDNVRKQK
ncbi:MAG TPA: spore germination protein [Mollicutes bacterium]|nr:spore germination protein [Mollicutes bacterium]